MPFIFSTCPIDGLIIIEPVIFPDDRGFFMETYKKSLFSENGIEESFLQDNFSQSSYGVLRGLHYQEQPHQQGKLVRCVEGSVWDVAVDLRKNSLTYGKWYGLELTSVNRIMLYIPPGFAHGFVVLSNSAQFQYKCTAEYNKESEKGICWNDPDLAIQWPLPFSDIIVSEKDKILPRFRELA